VTYISFFKKTRAAIEIRTSDYWKANSVTWPAVCGPLVLLRYYIYYIITSVWLLMSCGTRVGPKGANGVRHTSQESKADFLSLKSANVHGRSYPIFVLLLGKEEEAKQKRAKYSFHHHHHRHHFKIKSRWQNLHYFFLYTWEGSLVSHV